MQPLRQAHGHRGSSRCRSGWFLDYDGTIAVDGVLDPAVRGALDEARQRGVLVILVTGRRLFDLRTVAGDLTCFDAIVAENGAIVEFPAQNQRIVIGRPPHPAFVRHRSKYLEMPVLEGEAFVFTDHGRPGPAAHTLRELAALLSSLPAGSLAGHLQRHDFSRWIAGVFRDPELAGELPAAEQRIGAEDPRKIAGEIAHAIRARYEPSPVGPSARA